MARARSEKRGNIAGCGTGISNKPEEEEEKEEEEEYTVGNRKHLARHPVGENQDWENENEPTLGPSTLGIHGGRAGRFTKQGTTLPKERNKKMQGKNQEH